jgi:hypothetical protein
MSYSAWVHVTNLLPGAFVFQSQGGWALCADSLSPNLVSGAKTADKAWEKAALMLGWRKP